LSGFLKNKKYQFLAAALLFFATGAMLDSVFLKKENGTNQQQKLQKGILSLEKTLYSETKKNFEYFKQNSPQNLSEKEVKTYKELYDKSGIIFLVYKENEYFFWSHNALPYPDSLVVYPPQNGIIQLPNGWYECFSITENNFRITGYLTIKKTYSYKNRHLISGFNPALGNVEDAEIFVNKSEDENLLEIVDGNGNALFYMANANVPKEKSLFDQVSVFLHLTGIIFLLLYFNQELLQYINYTGKKAAALLFILFASGIRLCMILLEFPAKLYELPIFGPENYAASLLFPSIGDFFLNIIFLALFSWKIKTAFTSETTFNIRQNNNRTGIISSVVFGVFIFLYAVFCEELIKGLIEDSKIPFKVNNLFSLNEYSYISLFSVFLLLLSFVLFTSSFCEHIKLFKKKEKNLLLLFVLVLFFVFGFFAEKDFGFVIWGASTLLILYFSNFTEAKNYSFATLLIVLIFGSFFTAIELSHLVELRNKTQMEFIAEKLSRNDDPVAELLFAEQENKIQKKALSCLRKDTNNNTFFSGIEFERFLSESVFNGYLSRYSFSVFAFSPDGAAISPEMKSKVFYAKSVYDSVIAKNGIRTDIQNLFFIDRNERIEENYIIRMPVTVGSISFPPSVYILIKQRFLPDQPGFPELLLDESASIYGRELLKYSFARYKDSQIISHFGPYTYPVFRKDSVAHKTKNVFFESDGHLHLYTKIDEKNALLLSSEAETWLSGITIFSFLFTFFSLLLLLLYIINAIIKKQIIVTFQTIHSKIRFSLVMLAIISVLLLGLTTGYYLTEQHKQKNLKTLNEKMKSIQKELEQKLGDYKYIGTEHKEYAEYLLTKFSSVFFTDLNLFLPGGKLLASSQPKIYDAGIIADRMEPFAYRKMAIEKASEFIAEEKIGKLPYYSAYVPFFNYDGVLIAYINMPYFSRQSEIENEISTFLSAAINIYVLLFMLSVLAALFISSYITQPLRMLQEKISGLQLGKSNLIIDYKGQDEIGSLVEIYNQKVKELEISAELLAKSERESAWREMAKQVAHEIKNPLTPMKLSVQHLKRSLNPEEKDWAKKLENFSKTIIEQIDTLTNIASEFSNFAIMPRTKFEKVDLSDIIHSTMRLFAETENTEISFAENSSKPLYVYGDKEQLLRVFNNLIKNSIQAIPSDKKGKIETSAEQKNNQLFIYVKDNGTGIPEEQKEKIFAPNFTTKTTGMGLGLAIVKNIITSMNGTISFETKENTGTTFIISLPVYSDKETNG
jgi:two-component system, NtrC family, nitrogen regulation sensor histidine kinase NtrY